MPVFRYMQYQHFLDWVRTGLYRISNICKWEDPYENYLLKCPLLDRFGLRISKIVLPLYGQCWTTLPESDAMWRIYSKISRGQANDTVDSCEIGVRIKTTAERLQKLPSIITGFNRGHIGPVKYINQTVIDRNLQSLQLKIRRSIGMLAIKLFLKNGKNSVMSRNLGSYSYTPMVILHIWKYR